MKKIECTIKRPRRVSLGGKLYHFLEDELGRFVAEIEDEAHQAALLAIRCYREIAGEGEPPKDGSGTGEEAPPQTVTSPAAAVTAAPVLDPVKDDEDGDDATPDDEGSEDAGETSREALNAQFKALFGRNPRKNWSDERVAQEIAKAPAGD